MNFNGTEVKVVGGVLDDNEIQCYLEKLRQEYPTEHISELEIKLNDDDTVSLDYGVKPPKFQRIRRITGYLVGTLDRFNDAKRAEERQRVKHTIENVA